MLKFRRISVRSRSFGLAGKKIYREIGLPTGLEFTEGVVVNGTELFAVFASERGAELVALFLSFTSVQFLIETILLFLIVANAKY